MVASALLTSVPGAVTPAAATGKQAASSGLQDDASSLLKLKGPWQKSATSTASGGTLRTLNASGSATIVFDGSGVEWIARRSSFDGIAKVYVDGHRTTVDLYAPHTVGQQVVFTVHGLAARQHTLRIVRSGKKNSASVGRTVSIDAIRVLDATPPQAPTALSVDVEPAGPLLRWAPSVASDTAVYRVLRTSDDQAPVLVGVTSAAASSFRGAGLVAGARYRYSVVAVDASGNSSPPSSPVTFGGSASADPVSWRYASCPAPTVTVADSAELAEALLGAGPGTVVRMLPGTYSGQVKVTAHGSAESPVWLCGSSAAVVDGGGIDRNGGIRIADSSYLAVSGMTVRNSQKGVSVIASHDVAVSDLNVVDIGNEAIHLKSTTTASAVVGNVIDHTGLTDAAFGEGVYIGTDKNNWCAFTACEPDRSDLNSVVANTFTRVDAEAIEVKEGTSAGLISGNIIHGSSSGPGRLVALKGRGWLVTGNRGIDAGVDGIQVLERLPGWGTDNAAYANSFSGRTSGYAVRVGTDPLRTLVGCDNTVPSSARAVTDAGCTP